MYTVRNTSTAQCAAGMCWALCELHRTHVSAEFAVKVSPLTCAVQNTTALAHRKSNAGSYRVLARHRDFRHELRAKLAHFLRELLGQNSEVPAQPHGPAQVALVGVGLVGVGGGQAVAVGAGVGLRDRGVTCMDETVRKTVRGARQGQFSLCPGERGDSLPRAHNSAFTAQRQPTDIQSTQSIRTQILSTVPRHSAHTIVLIAHEDALRAGHMHVSPHGLQGRERGLQQLLGGDRVHRRGSGGLGAAQHAAQAPLVRGQVLRVVKGNRLANIRSGAHQRLP
jgi:hypothetical protein